MLQRKAKLIHSFSFSLLIHDCAATDTQADEVALDCEQDDDSN